MKQRSRKRFKLTTNYLLTFYDCMVREDNLTKAAAALGTKLTTLQDRIDEHEELQHAVQFARANRTKQTLPDYIFKSLSPEAQRTWDEIRKAKSVENIERIFSGKAIKLRQQLFIHALVTSGFDISSACRKVAIDRVRIEKWKHDLHFLQLLEEVQWHKKNFFEKHLIGLVEERHPGAVIFANRTINADRGYSEKLKVEHSGSVGRDFDIDDLDLDVETKRKVLMAIRKKNEAAKTESPTYEPPAIDLQAA